MVAVGVYTAGQSACHRDQLDLDGFIECVRKGRAELGEQSLREAGAGFPSGCPYSEHPGQESLMLRFTTDDAESQRERWTND
jgi:hypothetical protein